MSTTDTLTDQPETTRPDPTTQTAANPATPEHSGPDRPMIDVAPARKATGPGRIGVAFAIAASVGVGALVWAVIAGPTDTSVDASTHDRVEANRTGTLRDLSTQPTSSYDRVEANRTGTLRDLSTQPTSSYDRVEANRAATLRDLSTQPT